MKINEFLKNFKAQRFMISKNGADDRSEWLRKELEIKDYIPFREKQAIAQTVLISCASINDGVVVIDSLQKYMLFTMSMLVSYTNLEADEDMDIYETYDALCSCRVDDGTLLDAIIKTFEVEYARCNDVLNMMTADLLVENNIEKQVGKFLTNLSDKINKLGDKLIDNIEEFGLDLDQLDIDKLANIIEKIK